MSLVDSPLAWLLGSTLRASALIVVVLGLQYTLRAVMPARWRLWLWLPVLFVMAVPVVPTSSWSLERLVFSRPVDPELCCPTDLSVCPVPVEPMGSDAPLTAAERGWWIIGGCWLAGAAWFLGVVAWSYRTMMGRLQRHQAPACAVVQRLVGDEASAAGMRKLPPLLISTEVDSPAVAGLLRPTLLLPPHFPSGLSAAEAALVIKHELLHIRRLDVWAAWLLCVLQAVHWFNPLVWMACRKIRLDCEQARDEEVLAESAADCRSAYGGALIKMASMVGLAEPQLGILSMAPSTRGLHTRIRAVAGFRRVHRAWGILWMAVISTVTVLGATRSPAPHPGVHAPAALSMGAAERIILPEFHLSHASVEEALEHLGRAALAADPAGGGLQVWLTPDATRNAQRARISLSLTNTPAWEALVSIASQANLGLDGAGDLVCLKWPFAVRSWFLEAERLERLGCPSGADLRAWLSSRGVSFPPGSAAQLEAAPPQENGRRLVRLAARNSPENLRRIAALLHDPVSSSVHLTR